MDTKKMVWLGLFVGSTIGGLIGGALDGGNIFGLWGISLGSIGGLVGIWLGFKISQ